jgi:hypothetical protein
MIAELPLVLEIIRSCPDEEMDALGKRIAKSIERDKWDKESINRARIEWKLRRERSNDAQT